MEPITVPGSPTNRMLNASLVVAPLVSLLADVLYILVNPRLRAQ